MLVERAIEFTEQLVISSKHTLSDRDKSILRGSWSNLTYEAIKEQYQDSFDNCTVAFIKKVLGYKLWQKITSAFIAGNIISPEEKVHKLNFKSIVEQYEQEHELSLGHSSSNPIIGDRYQILSLIDRTEYLKTSYLVRHLNYFDRECIVEQLKATSESSLSFKALERRANILRDLGEKTVCTPKLFAWFAKEGYWHLIYESIRGTSLEAELSANTSEITELEAKALLKEVLEILAAIHQCNIVHRQISPNNLIRRDRDRDRKLALVNFEIAKYINTDNSFFFSLQHQINISYAAPEFITDPVFSTDLYSVGKIIILALTKLTPHQYRHNILDWHNNAHISAKFQNIIDKMILEKCDRRYQSAFEILNIL